MDAVYILKNKKRLGWFLLINLQIIISNKPPL